MPFVRLRPNEKCQICQHKGWCMKSRDAVICARVMSDKRVGNKGAGWLHKIADPIPKRAIADHRPSRPEPTIHWDRFNRRCVESVPDNDSTAEELGVSWESLGRLEIGWSVEHAAYTFPMRDGDGRIIGMRLRYRDGRKLAIRGSHNGLFIPRGEPSGEIWICEGPTDCAALLTVGLYAVGRPSNNGGKDHLVRYCQRHRPCREIVIVADRDAKPITENLTMMAVNELVAALKAIDKRCRVIRPPLRIKDVRAWINRGADAKCLRSIVNDAIWK